VLERRKAEIEHRTRHAAYPIGGSVLLAVVFVALMSLFFFV
jgi:hypothetical protein